MNMMRCLKERKKGRFVELVMESYDGMTDEFINLIRFMINSKKQKHKMQPRDEQEIPVHLHYGEEMMMIWHGRQ